METGDEQQFCLRWNNFQANITSQFETLRDDEDFTDVTIACEGQKLQAHKVVLSACSPYFKELFKSNPCSHPIIFMRDVESKHVVALMEFMYAGEVNVAQAHLSAFLKTAESLKIRGLTDTSSNLNQREEDTLFLNPQPSSSKANNSNSNCKLRKPNTAACSSTVTSSQDVGADPKGLSSPPPNKKQCKPVSDIELLQSQFDDHDITRLRQIDDVIGGDPFALVDNADIELELGKSLHAKVEIPDYLSDDEREDTRNFFGATGDVATLSGGIDMIQQNTIPHIKDLGLDQAIGSDSRKLHSLDPRPCEECGRVYSNLSNLRQHMKLIHYPTFVSCPICTKPFKTDLYLRRHMITTHETTNYKNPSTHLSSSYKNKTNCAAHLAISKSITSSNSAGLRHAKPGVRKIRQRRSTDNWSPLNLRSQFGGTSPDIFSRFKEHQERAGERRNRLVKLGEGIEIYEEQLRSVKWSDYRKLTRGLATILFSPAELATCSVTGQRWSRAGSGERPVKPALDRAKVQAIISYVATRFPMIEISRIKQVLAYKCKENSTAFKMKAVRYYGDQIREAEKN